MILKNDLTQFEFSVSKTDFKSGLSDGDYWLCVDVLVKNKDIFFKKHECMVSFCELNELVETIRSFLLSSDTKRKRISFIKNYFIVYLESKKKNSFQLCFKFIRFNHQHENCFVVMNREETQLFIDKMDVFLKQCHY